jgi:hypothetical protein
MLSRRRPVARDLEDLAALDPALAQDRIVLGVDGVDAVGRRRHRFRRLALLLFGEEGPLLVRVTLAGDEVGLFVDIAQTVQQRAHAHGAVVHAQRASTRPATASAERYSRLR